MSFTIPTFEKSKITNERQSVIKDFVDEINRERPCKYKDKNGKWKVAGRVSGRTVAIRLGMLKTTRELYEFLSECRDYRNRNGSFCKRFFV